MLLLNLGFWHTEHLFPFLNNRLVDCLPQKKAVHYIANILTTNEIVHRSLSCYVYNRAPIINGFLVFQL